MYIAIEWPRRPQEQNGSHSSYNHTGRDPLSRPNSFPPNAGSPTLRLGSLPNTQTQGETSPSQTMGVQEQEQLHCLPQFLTKE